MSPTSYQTAPPRGGQLSLAKPRGRDQAARADAHGWPWAASSAPPSPRGSREEPCSRWPSSTAEAVVVAQDGVVDAVVLQVFVGAPARERSRRRHRVRTGSARRRSGPRAGRRRYAPGRAARARACPRCRPGPTRRGCPRRACSTDCTSPISCSSALTSVAPTTRVASSSVSILYLHRRSHIRAEELPEDPPGKRRPITPSAAQTQRCNRACKVGAALSRNRAHPRLVRSHDPTDRCRHGHPPGKDRRRAQGAATAGTEREFRGRTGSSTDTRCIRCFWEAAKVALVMDIDEFAHAGRRPERTSTLSRMTGALDECGLRTSV